MQLADVRGVIRDFVKTRFMIGRPDNELGDSESMLEKGILDSTGVLELVGFIEEHYGISVEDEELTPDNLGTVENIVRYVQGKAKLAT
jgi:acyl carrier protein